MVSVTNFPKAAGAALPNEQVYAPPRQAGMTLMTRSSTNC